MLSLGHDAPGSSAVMSFDGLSLIEPTETITVQTPTVVTNAYGDSHDDWTNPTTRTTKAAVWPRTTAEDNDQRHATITGISIAVAPDEPEIPYNARIVARGRTWEVVGIEADWLAPWGWHPARLLDLEQVEG